MFLEFSFSWDFPAKTGQRGMPRLKSYFFSGYYRNNMSLLLLNFLIFLLLKPK